MARRLVAFVLVMAALGAPASALRCAISCEQREAIAGAGDVPPCHHADGGGIHLGRVPAPCGQTHGASFITRFEPQADRSAALVIVEEPGTSAGAVRFIVAPGFHRPHAFPPLLPEPHLPLRI